MNILDELRQKAEEKKQAQEQQHLLDEQLEQTYQQVLLPKIQFLYDCLSELIKYLNFLEEPIAVRNYSRHYPQFGTLFQKNYKINTDGMMGLADYNRLMQINIRFNCEAVGDFNYSLSSKALCDREHAFLFEHGLHFHQKSQHPDKVLFTVERKIPVRFQIAVDYPTSKLLVTIFNHENFETFHRSVTPEQLDDEFLDALLCYFMRRDNRFIRADISDATQAAIREHIAPFYDEERNNRLEMAPTKPQSGNKIADPIRNIFAKFNR